MKDKPRQKLLIFLLVILGVGAYFYFRKGVSPLRTAEVKTQGPARSLANHSPTQGGAAPVMTSSMPGGSASSPILSAQAEVALQLAVGNFQRDSVQAWQAVYREPGRSSLKTLKNGSIRLRGANVTEKSQNFLDTYSAALLGVDSKNLKIVQTENAERSRVVVEQLEKGVPVLSGRLVLFFEGENLTRVQSDLFPVIGDGTDPGQPPAVPAWAAGNAAMAMAQEPLRNLSGFEETWVNQAAAPKLIYFPSQDRLILAYSASVDVLRPEPKQLEILINAQSGRVFRVRDRIVH